MALVDELNALHGLYEKGNLTDQEYAAAKAATLNKQEAAASDSWSAPVPTSRTKAIPVLLLSVLGSAMLVGLLIVGFVWYTAGTKNTAEVLATVVHAPITLKDEVENVPAHSEKGLGINVPYGGTVDVSMEVVRGNPLDMLLVDADEAQAIQGNNWSGVRSYVDFSAVKTKDYHRTSRLNAGTYYLMMRDTSLGILSASASDVSVKVQLNP